VTKRPVHDVAYLITQSIDHRGPSSARVVTAGRLPRGTRRRWNPGLYPQQCEDDYRLAALHCFEYAVVVAGTLYHPTTAGSRWITQMIGRSDQTIVDLDLLDLLD